MTYPPQQPGPYGQSADPYGQQQPWGNPQQGPPQSQPGYPAPGQVPYAQPDPYGQHPQYGQQPGGYPPGPPPKKNKTGLIVAIVIVAVLLGGGGVTAVLLLTGDEEQQPRAESQAGSQPRAGNGHETGGQARNSSPEQNPNDPTSEQSDTSGSERDAVMRVAQTVVSALNAHDLSALNSVACEGTAMSESQLPPGTATYEIMGNPEVHGNKATVPISIVFRSKSHVSEMPLRKQSGTWCVMFE